MKSDDGVRGKLTSSCRISTLRLQGNMRNIDVLSLTSLLGVVGVVFGHVASAATTGCVGLALESGCA